MRQFLCLLFLFSFISNKTLTSTNALRYCVCHYVCILCSLCFMYFICCNLSKKKNESLNFFYMFPWIFVGFFFFFFPELQNKTLTSGLFAILKNFVLVYFFFKPLRQVLRQRTTSENKNCGNLQCWSVCFVTALFGTYSTVVFLDSSTSRQYLGLLCDATQLQVRWAAPRTCTCLRIRLHRKCLCSWKINHQHRCKI